MLAVGRHRTVAAMAASRLAHQSRIYLVECYAPAGYRPEIESVLRAACSATAGITGDGAIEYVGAVLMPGDDLVFYAVRARDLDSVQRIANRADVVHERIVESVLLGMEWTQSANAALDAR